MREIVRHPIIESVEPKNCALTRSMKMQRAAELKELNHRMDILVSAGDLDGVIDLRLDVLENYLIDPAAVRKKSKYTVGFNDICRKAAFYGHEHIVRWSSGNYTGSIMVDTTTLENALSGLHFDLLNQMSLRDVDNRSLLTSMAGSKNREGYKYLLERIQPTEVAVRLLMKYEWTRYRGHFQSDFITLFRDRWDAAREYKLEQLEEIYRNPRNATGRLIEEREFFADIVLFEGLLPRELYKEHKKLICDRIDMIQSLWYLGLPDDVLWMIVHSGYFIPEQFFRGVVRSLYRARAGRSKVIKL